MNFFKIAKGFSLSLLVAAIMFSSSVFTAILYAKMKQRSTVSDAGTVQLTQDKLAQDNTILLENHEEMIEEIEEEIVKTAAMLDAPLILQYPELPRGCEITTLTMLINFKGIVKDKMELVKEMKFDNTPIQWGDHGNIAFWGHPNEGFVGDITLNSSGFGVYHKPMMELLEKYIPTARDLTGEAFSEIEKSISNGVPVMVWTTVNYKVPEQWMEWDTPIGKVKTTTKEHTVLMVGYDENYVYVNDPLKKTKQIKIEKQQFIESWEAMGKQAITYVEA